MTMENPSSSLFWLTEPFLQLEQDVQLFHSDSQMCMMGGTRPKWTRIVASFSAISELNATISTPISHGEGLEMRQEMKSLQQAWKQNIPGASALH